MREATLAGKLQNISNKYNTQEIRKDFLNNSMDEYYQAKENKNITAIGFKDKQNSYQQHNKEILLNGNISFRQLPTPS